MVILLTSDSLNMETGDMDGEEQPCITRTSDRLAVSDDEDQRIIFPNSAFRPVKYSAECSPSFPQPQVLSPPPFLPTSSPGWYSSLYRTGREQNNNLEPHTEDKKENEPGEGKAMC